jgi:anti-sigma regulatory factor (Ser/Thr protein kinase)
VNLDRLDEGHMHQALFYRGEREYLDGVMGFITPALAAGEPVTAAIPPVRGESLRRALNGYADEVEILDVFELGRNPARIIPAVERILARHHGSRLHYVGEPIWPGRSIEEIQEATRHEALINLAWPGAPIRLLCPYDVDGLAPEVLADAEQTHPTIIEQGRARASFAYRGSEVPSGSDQPLPGVPAEALEQRFALHDLYAVRHLVADEAAAAQMSQQRVEDLVLAVSEVAANAIRHGHGSGVLRVWRRPDRLFCQVDCRGHIQDPLAGRRFPGPQAAGGIGLWAVNQLCDLVEVRSSQEGTTVRMHSRLH